LDRDPTDIGSLLIAANAVDPDTVAAAARRQERTKSRLGTELLNSMEVDPRELADALIAQARIRGTTPDWAAYMRTIGSSTSLHYYRAHEAVQKATESFGSDDGGVQGTERG
jgi:hypothetical protein